MWDERNTGTNLPAQIEIYADTEPGHELVYKFLVMAKGGGSANKSFLFQETKALLNPASMTAFLDEKLRSLGTAACPPYHLAVVIGGTSAEYALKVAKYASTKYLDTLPTSGSPDGHAFRDLAMEDEVLALTQAVRDRGPVRREVLLPRRPRGPPSTARRIAARWPSRSPARPTGRLWPGSRRRASSWSSWSAIPPSTCLRSPTSTSTTTWSRSTSTSPWRRSAPS